MNDFADKHYRLFFISTIYKAPMHNLCRIDKDNVWIISFQDNWKNELNEILNKILKKYKDQKLINSENDILTSLNNLYLSYNDCELWNKFLIELLHLININILNNLFKYDFEFIFNTQNNDLFFIAYPIYENNEEVDKYDISIILYRIESPFWKKVSNNYFNQ